MPCITDILFDIFPRVLAEDFLRYALGAGGVHLLVSVLFARWSRRRQVRAAARPGWPQIRREVAVSLRTALIFAAVGTALTAGVMAGVLRVYTDATEHGLVWMAASVLIMIVAQDAFFYWAHRLMHGPVLFRLFHRTHHRSHNPTVFTAYSFDASEALVHAVFLPAILLVLPAHPAAIAIFLIHMILRNAIGHSGVELFPAGRDGRPLLGWLTTVTHHDLHHENARWNMGLYFTFWDRLMGSEHPDYAARFRAATRAMHVPVVGSGPAVALAVLLLLIPAPVTAGDEAPLGYWAAPDLGSVLRLEVCPDAAGRLCARGRGGAWRLLGLRPGPVGWSGGRIVDRASGTVQEISLALHGRDRLRVHICGPRGCRTEAWWSVDALRGLARITEAAP